MNASAPNKVNSNNFFEVYYYLGMNTVPATTSAFNPFEMLCCNASAAVNLQNVKKRGAYSGQLDDESACVILDQFFATGGLNGSAERVQPQGGVVQEAEVALAKAAAVAAMQEDYEERKEAAAERGELLRAPMEVSDFTGETEDQFDIDAFDLEGEIASRAAALDSSDEEGGTSVS
jgi:hypothetical protein